jgi:hypothetical protein
LIVFDLQCAEGCDSFEAWFRSGADYDEQRSSGFVHCPGCGSDEVAKAPMAPRLPRKGRGGPLAQLAALQGELLKDSRWVGDAFVDTARAIHLGEAEARAIHGRASREDAQSLAEDGIPVAPLPFPVTEPGEEN